ncbi:hypothetical protein ACHAWF_015520, partial [Thalassiosira exigua]
MLSSHSSALGKFFQIHKEAENWTAGPIRIPIAKSFSDDSIITINLTDTIGKNKKVPKPFQRSDDNCYWLQKSLSENNYDVRQKTIYPLFFRACHSAGFTIHGEYEKEYECIVFECSMGKFHDETKVKSAQNKRHRIVKNQSEPPKERTRRTLRPIKGGGKDILCPFRFRVYWDNNHRRWFLPHLQMGNPCHCGHISEKPEFIRIRSKFAPDNDLKISKDAMECNISATASSSLFTKRSGLSLEWHQLQYLKKMNKNDLVMNGKHSLKSTDVSAIDRLIADLESDPTISYTCLYGEFDSGLLTLKTKRKHMNNSVEIDIFDTKLDDGVDDPVSFANDCKARSALTNSSNGKIALAVCWTTTVGRRKFDQYPEMLGGDDTEETNSEDRPLYTLCGKDNMNKSFGHTWCFMPSKSQWVYNWIFNNAVPTLHPGTATKRVELFITDADKQETQAAENACGEGIDTYKTFPNAKHRQCGWHKINRNFTESSDYKSKLSSQRKKCIQSSIEIDLIVRWMWYFIKHYENPSEVKMAMTLLHIYLNESQDCHYGVLDEDVRSDIRSFITKSFQCNENKLFEAYFDGIMSMGTCTTSINEAEHRAYKKHCQGPKPQHDIAESAKCINDINKSKEARKSRKISADMRGTRAKTTDRDELGDDRLTDHCNKMLCDEYN